MHVSMCAEARGGFQASCSYPFLLHSFEMVFLTEPELDWQPASSRNHPVSAPSNTRVKHMPMATPVVPGTQTQILMLVSKSSYLLGHPLSHMHIFDEENWWNPNHRALSLECGLILLQSPDFQKSPCVKECLY